MLLNNVKLFKVLTAGWLKVNLPLTLIWAENALDLDRQVR